MPKHRIVTSHAAHSTARQDPYFVETVADLLIFNAGERVNLTELTGADSQVIGEAVDFLRRLGLVIEAEQGRAGYTLHGWSRVRWVHVGKLAREYAGVMARTCDRRHRVRECPGQLTFVADPVAECTSAATTGQHAAGTNTAEDGNRTPQG